MIIHIEGFLKISGIFLGNINLIRFNLKICLRFMHFLELF